MSGHPFRYQVGGCLPLEFPGYVKRGADLELVEHLLQGQTCSVFNSRQMGKSSLKVRAIQRLRKAGRLCAVIDPQCHGTTATEPQWYAGTVKRLIEEFGLEKRLPYRKWREQVDDSVSPVLWFFEFIDRVLLPATGDNPLVIFVEEVDSLISLEFGADGFFTLIRCLHERRADHPIYRRLCFAFLGVATPYDLIRGKDRSSFNSYHAVELAGFTLEEARPLLAGLEGRVAEPEAALAAVVHWSGGQPFLTQKLLALLLEEPQGEANTKAWVAEVVRRRVLTNWENNDTPPHLQTIRDRLLLSEERGQGRPLSLALALLKQGSLPMEQTGAHQLLRLSGLVSLRQGQLELSNPIVAALFDQAWLERQLADLRPPIYREALHSWKKAETWQRGDYLIVGAPLQEALAWAHGRTLADDDDEFLDASRKADETAQRAEQTAREAEHAAQMAQQTARLAEERAARAEQEAFNRRRLALALFVGLAGMLILSAVAWMQMHKAQEQATIARLREQATLVDSELGITPVEALIRAIAIAGNTENTLLADVANMGSDVLSRASEREQEVERLRGHGNSVHSVTFSPDGKYILSGSSDNTLRIWDAISGKAVTPPLRGHKSSILSVAFSRDGKRIVSGSKDNTLRLWDANTGKAIGKPIQGHDSWVNSVVFSPDGKFILSGSLDNTLRLWDVNSRQQVGVPLRGHTSWVLSVAFSPDGKQIISGSRDMTLQLWDTATGNPIGPPLRGHTNNVLSVGFSHDSKRIISGSADNTLRLWDVDSGKPIGDPLEGHTNSVWSVAFDSDSKRIVSGSEDKSIRIWDALTGKAIGNPLQGHTNSVISVAFSPDGKHIVSGSDDNSLRIWDATTDNPIGDPLEGHANSVLSVAFSPDGNRIVSGSGDNSLRIWDANTGKPIGSPLRGHTSRVNSVAFSPDGRLIVSGSKDKSLRVWDAFTGRATGILLRGHQDQVVTVAFSPDGRRIVSGSEDKSLRIWDVNTSRLIGSPLRGHANGVLSVSFSPNGKRIVSGSRDNNLRIWNADNQNPIGQPLQGHTNAVRSVSFSPDGRRILSGSSDNSLRLWDAVTGNPIGSPFQAHTQAVRSVAFSTDGKRIVSGSMDNSLRLWDAATGKQIGTSLQGHFGPVQSVAFSPDGRRIVSGSDDATLRLWDATPASSLRLACKRLQRHQLLLRPEAFLVGPEFEAIARRARAVCANPPAPPPLTWPAETSAERASAPRSLLQPLARAWMHLRQAVTGSSAG